MGKKTIDILVVEPDKEPYEKTIYNQLSSMQEVVGGLIEVVSLENDESVVLICNEEGKLENLPLNRSIDYDIIAGTFFVAGDSPNGDFKSLTKEQMEKYKKEFDLVSKEKVIQKLDEIGIKIIFPEEIKEQELDM